MGIITGLGWLFSGAVGFVPGLPKSVFMAAAALLVVTLASGYAWHKGSEGKGAAVAAEKAACLVKIGNAQTAAERTIADILSSIDPTEHDGKTAAELCKGDPLCLGGGK